MKQSEFLFRLKTQIPNIKETGITDNEIVDVLNQAVDQINLLTRVHKTYTNFSIVADQQLYALSTIAPTYLGMDKKEIFLKDANADWQPLFPKTKDWISKTYKQWLNAESVTLPNWYWIEGDELGFYPPPDVAYTNGGRLYHIKKSTGMSNDDHYPWTGSTTQITAFVPLDDAIVAYVRWKLSPAIGAVTDADLRYKEFLQECKKGTQQINRRPDLTADSQYGIKIL